jgi:Fe-S-cluster-containing hydrogenase component 2
MVSINDEEDLHFRKATFDATRCPPDCSRPCERVCPTDAIPPLRGVGAPQPEHRVEGVGRQERCYGCGRCLAVCPLGLITAQSYMVDAPRVLSALQGRVDALEIHTNSSAPWGSPPRPVHLGRLWGSIQQQASRLRAVSVSFPYMGSDAATKDFLMR